MSLNELPGPLGVEDRVARSPDQLALGIGALPQDLQFFLGKDKHVLYDLLRQLLIFQPYIGVIIQLFVHLQVQIFQK